MSKAPKASLRQAETLASMFSGWKLKIGSGHEPPTHRVIVKNGWASPTGEIETYPSGAEAHVYSLNPAGELALECYLQQRRMDRFAPLKGAGHNPWEAVAKTPCAPLSPTGRKTE